MIMASVIAVFLATIAIWSLMAAFLKSIKRESPAFYESWGRPTLGRYLRNRQFFVPISAMFLFRTYREQLGDCPHSRAWGSWLFLAYWIQWAAMASLVVALARRYL